MYITKYELQIRMPQMFSQSIVFSPADERPRTLSQDGGITMTEDVILFQSGETINDGDIFKAKVDSVEGHRRVTLVIQKDPLEGRTENDLIRMESLEK